MSIARIYSLIWIVSVAAAGLLFLTGLFTASSLIVFGMFFIGLIFMGIVAVLPSSVGSQAPSNN